MIGVEHRLRLREVDDLLGALGPRQRHEPIHIGARHRVLGGRRRHLRKAIEFAQSLLLHRLRHSRRFNLLGQFFDFLRLVVTFAEFLLDGLHLLAQEVLALVLADLGLHLRLNLRAELEHLEFLDQDSIEVVHPGADVERLEDLLLHRRADGGEARGNEVGEPAGLGDVGGERLQVVREQWRQRHHLLEVRLDVPGQRIDFEAVGVVSVLAGGADARTQVRMGRHHFIERQPRKPLHDEAQAAVRQLEHLVDVRRGADLEQVILARFLKRSIALREDRDQLAVGDSIVDEAHGAFARHGERHERVGEEYCVPQRQDRKFWRNRKRPIGNREVLGLEILDLIAHGETPSKVDRERHPGVDRKTGVRKPDLGPTIV